MKSSCQAIHNPVVGDPCNSKIKGAQCKGTERNQGVLTSTKRWLCSTRKEENLLVYSLGKIAMLHTELQRKYYYITH